MEMFDVTQVALERALQGSSLRQQALANNLANANTPGFKRSDVHFQDSLARALAMLSPRRGTAPVAAASDALDELTFAPEADTTSAMRADGNNVDVDTEMATLQENSLEYQALTSVARARISMLRTVIAGGGS